MPIDLATLDKTLMAARPPKDPTSKNILTPIGRLSFPNFFTPRASGKNPKPEDKKKYGTAILIPPTCDLGMLKKAAEECAMAEWGSKVRDMKIRSPFLKAEEYKREGYLPGWTLLRASTLTRPDVVEKRDGALVRITEDDPEIVYAGRWATISLKPFCYDNTGNRGITFGLNNVMLLNHDDNLGGRMKAEDEFEAPEGDFGAAGAAAGTVDSLF